jgi:hypothetical protein
MSRIVADKIVVDFPIYEASGSLDEKCGFLRTTTGGAFPETERGSSRCGFVR